MDLRNWEHYADTGAPVVGATVEVREAGLTSPNVSAVLASTTTNADGMWAFTGLTDTPKDIKVLYSGQIWWYKGLSRYSASAIFSAQVWGGALQYPLTRNGGFEKWNSGVAPGVIGGTLTRVADQWFAQASGGSSVTVSREATVVAPDSQYAAKLIFARVGSGQMILFYAVQAPSAYATRGKDVSFSVQVRQGVAGSARAFIADNTGTYYSSTSAVTGSFVTMSVSRTISSTTTVLNIGIALDLSDTVYVDDAIAELGTTIPTYVPNPLDTLVSEEWAVVDQSVTVAQSQNTLQATLDAIVGRIKAIAGTTNWYDAPASTIAALVSSLASGLALKVAKAGDTMSGALSITNNVASVPALFARNQQAGALGIGLAVVNAAGSAFDLIIEHTTATFGVAIAGTSAALSGAISAASGAISGAFTVGSGGSLGEWTAVTLSASTDVTIAGTSVKARSTHTGTQAPSTISPQGSGSTLDADTVDGSHASALLARANHTGTQAPATISPQGSGSGLDADTLDGLNSTQFARTDVATNLALNSQVNSSLIWTAANDGTGSTMDADLVDGLQASQLLARANHTGTQVASTLSDLATAILARSQHTGTQAPTTISPQGAASGLDADTVDGSHASAFATSGHTHTATSANGSYSGNSAGSRVITNALPFQPRMVVVSATNNTATAIVLRDNVWRAYITGGSGSTFTAGSIDAAGFTVPTQLNTTGDNYVWSAFA